ncbi:MAG TPA: lipid-A-disaccharide synthase [Terracidiphilus sp.]|nr:lipid-A-disaccharide synthase [Terracidiphilus sp.]
MSHPVSIFVSAGEASGEHYGALLVESLQRHLAATGQSAEFFGMGGPRMAAAGLENVVRSEDMAVMGITEVVRHLPRIYGEFRKLKAAIRARRPAVAVLIDFPDIHFRLAKQLHALGIPVIFFVSPQLWAWKKHRIKLVQKYIRQMLVIFPFEQEFYHRHGVVAQFVGHPLADLPLPSISRADFAQQHDLDPDATWIGLLPGSREKEIRANLPEMLAAARILTLLARPAESPRARFQFVLPLAPTLGQAQCDAVQALVREHGPDLPVRFTRDARAALHHARASIVASGTATVEAALIGNPFVVVYRVSPLTYAIARRIVKVPHVAMPNLIAGRRVVPELIQSDFVATNIVRQLALLLPDGPVRQSMMQELRSIRDQLSTGSDEPGTTAYGAIERVAAITLRHLAQDSSLPESVSS